MPVFLAKKANNAEDVAKIKKIIVSQAGEKGGVNKTVLVAGLLRAGFKLADVNAAITEILAEGNFEEVNRA